MIITGIGSRIAPLHVLNFIKSLPLCEHIVRSGGAVGCDSAFEATTNNLEVYIPWFSFNDKGSKLPNSHIDVSKLNRDVYHKAYEIAELIHPAFNQCSNAAKKLHTRNVFQILGRYLKEDDKSDVVICWTPDGANSKESCTRNTGGTATAIILASEFNIPILNIFNERDLNHVFDLLDLWGHVGEY